MAESALSAANFFIDLATDDNSEIKPLKLMKLVYIAHGFCLALLERTFLNPRFDWVEAWKYGPVIPSVYHSFKQYGNTPVTDHTVIFDWENIEEPSVVTPTLNDENIKKVCSVVWKRYKGLTDSELVELLHGSATPWAHVYVEGANRRISDELTRLYYKGLVRRLRENAQNGKN